MVKLNANHKTAISPINFKDSKHVFTMQNQFNSLLSCVALMGATLQAMAVEEIAVIGTRTEQVAAQLPAGVAVVDQEALARLGATHAQEALRQIPGVGFQRGNGQESLPSIRSAVLTGAGACGNILVLEDAIPVRGAGFCNVNELFDTHYEHASRIEVTRGASTAFYGSNALLGAINVHLPVLGDNSLALEAGPHDYVRAKASIGYGDSTPGRVFVSVTDDGGFRDDSGYRQNKVSWRQQAAIGDWSLSLGATYTDLDQETAGFISGADAYLDDNLVRRNFDPEAFRDTQSLRAWARFEREFGNRSLVITPYLRDTDMDFRLHFLPGDPLEQNRQTGLGWQSALTTQASESLRWSVGFDAEFAEGELEQTQDQPTQGSAFLQATIPTGTHYDYQVDSTQLGVFGHVDWSPNEQWQVLLGARVESIEYDYDNLGLDGRSRDDGTECGFGGCRYSRPADREDDFTHFSPKLEVRYQVNDAWRWHFALADSFRAPQATELYRLQRQQQVADLDEVRATHIEAGAKLSLADTSLAISLYQINQSNVIIRDADFFNVDGQKTDSTGLELLLNHRFDERWSFKLAASLADHEYASDQLVGGQNIRGNQVDTAPEFVGSAFLNWQATNRLNTEVELHRTSKYFLEPGNNFTYPGHTLLHVRSSYAISDALKASLRLFNVTDKRFAERADFTSFTDQRYFPGEPRSLFGELKWTF